jgi:hypothetical protein
VAVDPAGATSTPLSFTIDVETPVSAEDPYVLPSDGAMRAGDFPELSFPTHLLSMSSGTLFLSEGVDAIEVRAWDGLDREAFARTSNVGGYRHVELQGDNPAGVVMMHGANVILGNTADNVLYGQGGDDTLYGAGGDDALYVVAGDDVLVSGTGSNELHGGAGDDRYEIGGQGEAGLREGDLDTIFDAEGANVVDFDGVAGDKMSFNMGGDDLVIAVDGQDAVKINRFDQTDATFEVQADDGSWDHAALLAAVEEVRAQTASVAGDAASFKADVLDGFLDDDAAAPRSSDPLAAFTPERGEVDEAPADGRGGASTPADEPAGTFVAPEEGATTTAAAAGLATKTALEEDPAYA